MGNPIWVSSEFNSQSRYKMMNKNLNVSLNFVSNIKYYYSTSSVLLDENKSGSDDQTVNLHSLENVSKYDNSIRLESNNGNNINEVNENVSKNNENNTKDEVLTNNNSIFKDLNLDRKNESYSNKQSENRRNPIEDDIIQYHPETYSLIQDTTSMVDESEIYYDNYCNDHRRSLDLNDDLSFIKSPAIARQQLLFHSLYYKWKIREELYRLYLKAIYKIINVDEPISEVHIKDLSLSLIALRTNHDLPLFSMMPNKTLTIGRTVYGMSHAANDLVHFYHSDFKRLDISVVYDSSVDTSENSIFSCNIDLLDKELKSKLKYDSSASLRSFDIISSDKIGNYIKENSGYLSSSYISELCNMYSINGSVSVEFSNISVSERKAIITTSKSNKVTFSDGTYIANSITDSLTIPLHNDVIISQLSSLFLINDSVKQHIDSDHMCQYLASSVYEYIKNHVKHDSSTFITKFEFKIQMTRNIENEKLYELYTDNIKSGRFVPISPIHYYSYFNGISEKWRIYSFLSTLACPSINKRLISVMPHLSSENKNYFISYAITRDKLGSYYYDSHINLPYQQEKEIRLSFDSFIKEMWVRTMLSDDIPEFYMSISAGRWSGTANSSVNVSPASLNKIICKLSISGFNTKLHDMSQNLTFGNFPFIAPEFVKTGYRLSRFIPDVFGRFLPDVNGYRYPVVPKPKDDEVEL